MLFIAILAAILVLILFMPLDIAVTLQWDKEAKGVFLEIVPFIRFLKFEKSWFVNADEQQRLVIIAETEGSRGEQKSASETRHSLLDLVNNMGKLGWVKKWWYSPATRSVLRQFIVRSLSWVTHIATGEMASTGILCGMMWGIKGALIGWTSNVFTVERLKVEVWPEWHQATLTTKFNSIVRTRIAHIITIGIIAAWYYLNYQILSR